MTDVPEPTEAFLCLLDPDPAVAALKFRRLFTHLSRWIEWKGCVDPEAAAAETVFRAVSRLNHLEGRSESDLRAFLFGIAGNVAHEAGRRRNREHQLSPAQWAARPVGISAEDRIVARLTIAKIRACLGEEDWRMIHGYATSGDHPRLCEQLGVTQGALRVRIYRIRQKIRECLSGPREGEA